MNTKTEIIAKSRWATFGRKTIGTDEYLTMETAAAVCVLPYDAYGKLMFISQFREDSKAEFSKTVGGYVEAGETHEKCVARNLLKKAGVKATEFVEVSRTFGYGDVIKVPIKLYVCRPGSWEIVGQGSCERVFVSSKDLSDMINEPGWYDDATRLLILLYLAGKK